MKGPWRCLDCGVPTDARDEKCDLCKSSMDDQLHQGPDLWAVAAGLDMRTVEDSDEYRRTKNRRRP